MPHSNLTPETATEILVSALPYIASVDVSDLAGERHLYYKLRNDLTRDAVVTFWFYGVIPSAPTIYYSPDYEGYDDVGLSNNVFDAYPNSPSQVPIKPGASYWVETSNAGYGTDLSLTLNINISLKPHSTSYPAGQIIIVSASLNSYFVSKGGLPAGFIDPNFGEIVNFIPFFPSSETGDVLNNGTYLFYDNGRVVAASCFLMFNPSFVTTQVINFPDPGSTFEPLIRTNNATNKFWIAQTGHSGTPNRYANISSAGVLSSATSLTAFPGADSSIGAHAATNNESHLLLAPRRGTVNSIYKWNLSTLAWDGTIGTAITDHWPTDMLVLADDTIVISYVFSKFGQPNHYQITIIRRYDLSGTQLNTITITNTARFSANPRLGYAADPLFFWLWMPLSDGRSIVNKIRASDFVVTIDTEVRNVYETALGEGRENPNPELIYVSDSCPIIETRVSGGSGETPPAGSPGLVKIVPDKRDDITGAIPTPTFRTGLMP